MEKRKWLWKKKSSERGPETESSGSVSSLSERFSDEQDTSKASHSEDSRSPEVTSNTSERGEDVDDRIKTLTEKLSATLVNVSVKDELVKQHSKVAEEAIAGWEKAENEVSVLKQQLENVIQQKTELEDRVAHLDGALKECVRQLRQARDEQDEIIARKTREFESAKSELKNQIAQLKAEAETAKSGSFSQTDLGFHDKLEHLEKDNESLKHDLLSLSQELQVRTIERDLSAQAAEAASKQHLECIKKGAKLETECRRLKALVCKETSLSDQKNCGPLINGMRNLPSTSVEIDLMDDFLEMERLAAMAEPEKIETCEAKSEAIANAKQFSELDIMIHRVADLEEKIQKMEGEKVESEEKLEKMLMKRTELETALTMSREKNEKLQTQLRETGLKLEELQEELLMANKSKEGIESQLVIMEAEVRTTNSKAKSYEAEAEKERASSVELNTKCKALEKELQSAFSNTETKIKQEDIATAAGKLAECQKTIASLGKQMKSLATLEDFLTDTVNVPELPTLGVSPNRDSTCSNATNDRFGLEVNRSERLSPPSSASAVQNHVSYGKNRNGFAKFFSRSKNGNGIQLQV